MVNPTFSVGYDYYRAHSLGIATLCREQSDLPSKRNYIVFSGLEDGDLLGRILTLAGFRRRDSKGFLECRPDSNLSRQSRILSEKT